MDRSRITTITQMISSMIPKSPLTIFKHISPGPQRRDSSYTSAQSSSWQRKSSFQVQSHSLNCRSPEKVSRKPAGPRKTRPAEEITALPSLAEATKGKMKSEQNGASQAEAIDVDEEPGSQAGPSTPSQRPSECPLCTVGMI